MLLESQHWHFGYEQIKSDCQGSEEGHSALLLCNADVDAMASARILSYMFRSDGVHYQLLPCTNYTSLEKHLRTCQLDTVRAIILLNFGASRNLTRIFEEHEELHENTKIYVLDCRRPVHLANVYAGNNVVIFYDGTQNNDHIPSDGDNLSGNESSSSEDGDSEDGSSSDDDSIEDDVDEGDESEEEATFDDISGTRGSVQPPLDEQSVDYDGEDEGDAENDPEDRRRKGSSERHDDASDTEKNANKRQRVEKLDEQGDDGATDVEQSDGDSHHVEQPIAKVSPREMHRQRRERLRAYYSSGTFFGSPASFIAYQVASQHRFGEQGDLLWLACVGVTDAYLHARVDITGYAELALVLRQSCLKLFPTDLYERAINTVYAEDLTGNTNRRPNGRTKITFSDNGRIVAEKDYRFFLLRHSSLFDSMIHSEYVSTKLQVWTKKGMHKLQELLAKMGYPLDECRQPFAYMKPNLRRRLHEKIMSHAEVCTRYNFAGAKETQIITNSPQRFVCFL